MSVDVWDRPVFQLNYNISNFTNYYTKTEIDYFFSQVYLQISDINDTLDVHNSSIETLFNITYELNNSINILSGNISNLTQLVYDINDSILYPAGDYFIINTSEHKFYFNETKNNATIRSISKIYEYEYDMNITGNNAVISTAYIGFEIKEVIVIPAINNSIYRFELTEYPSGDMIDRDRIPHTNIWAIEKNYPINYSQVLANITNANALNNFTVRIKYLSNGVE